MKNSLDQFYKLVENKELTEEEAQTILSTYLSVSLQQTIDKFPNISKNFNKLKEKKTSENEVVTDKKVQDVITQFQSTLTIDEQKEIESFFFESFYNLVNSFIEKMDTN